MKVLVSKIRIISDGIYNFEVLVIVFFYPTTFI